MKTSAARLMQAALIVIAGVAISGSARAQTYTWARWRNADTTHGTFYLGVKGGEVCDSSGACQMPPGRDLITWEKGGVDQLWGVLTGQPPGIVDSSCVIMNDVMWYGLPITIGFPWRSIGIDESATAITASPSVNQDSFVTETAESLGAPYPGCYAFEGQTGFLSVYQGNVKNGSPIVIWPLCVPGSGNCSNPSSAWHPYQFWCPEI